MEGVAWQLQLSHSGCLLLRDQDIKPPVKELFKKLSINYFAFEVDVHKYTQEIKDGLFKKTKQKTVPNVFIRGHHIGGCDNTMQRYHDGTLFNYLEGREDVTYDFDLVVIGGGSGGIAAAKEAAVLGKKVALFDFVKPTNHGTKWGVGGACVNVGCIPKKLMHQAAILGDLCEDASTFGWETNFSKQHTPHSWNRMVENIQTHIKKLNFGYLKTFKKKKISYFNAFVTFRDQHTIEAKDKKDKVTVHTAQIFILATGGRPHIPNFPGSELAITSDDLFSLKERPGKTLIVGASYIALECAGFLSGVGIDCTVMVRSILLRGFDQQIANMIGSHLESHGVKFIKGYVPSEITSVSEGEAGHDQSRRLKVKMINIDRSEDVKEDYYHTVLLAVGRDAQINGLGLENLGIIHNERNKKILVDEFDRTSCTSVYAIGDIQYGRMELTPVAIKAGKLLAQRMYGKGTIMDYETIATTVFTPLEYGCCGYSEEAAKAKFGEENVDAFHSRYDPLEWLIQGRDIDQCYAKLVCLKSEKMRVIGFHILGPNAGEITQGFALAIKMNATKTDFDGLVGIHPTCAEVFTSLEVTRSAQPEPEGAASKGC
ncbi:thioredoxin reductase 1, cytoplasmic-like isoform X2 [Lycorma delicatula]|uniref:thioredoxin reductase 1, cytoplasmic-like isoform X2 n=1 Tax=Lycorma delicatula TaxID=130591 RepID=UPI003F517CA3